MKGGGPVLELYIPVGNKKLRCGYTTGTCAAAATAGAVRLLLTGEILPAVRVRRPKGRGRRPGRVKRNSDICPGGKNRYPRCDH